ncbi:MAG: cation:proton antiporter [Clostridia bacterium]|nr:cation:proton antiporter [Clostridia bacterium]
MPLYEKISTSSPVASVIISVSLMLFCGFAMTRITKRLKLPNVTAYILAGILIGPACFNLIPPALVSGMDFIADIALAFIAFGTGEFFRFSSLKKNGRKVIVIALLETILASALIFLLTRFVLRLDTTFSIVLSALAAATASASTIMTIRQTGSKGDFVDTLLQVIAIDNVIALVTYSVAISVAVSAEQGISFLSIVEPVAINIGVLILGGIFGIFMKLLMPRKRSTDNRLIISVALMFAFCGICAVLDVSPLLGCMSMGMVYINISDDDKLFKQLNYFSPPILLLFFVRSGLSFDLKALTNTSAAVGASSLLLVSVLYFFVRMLGKYGGAYLGCLLMKKKPTTRNYLGLALVPQAGVAIGLAALGARALGGETGKALETIILASSILYELVGPPCAKMSLYLSKSYSKKLEDMTGEVADLQDQPNEVELLIARIKVIQSELPERVAPTEEEQAFLDAAEDQYASLGRSRMNNKRR